MVSRDGFTRVLLRRFAEAAASGAPKRQVDLFYEMEDEFEARYEAPLNWSYEAYKKHRDRHHLTADTGAAPED